MAVPRKQGRRYKLLALDIDGTLLTTQGEITPATQAALRRARDAGMIVTLATGRRLSTTAPYARALGIDVPLIVQSGAQIVEAATAEVLYRNPLPAGRVAEAVRLAVEEGAQPILYENRAVEQHLLIGPPEHDSAPLRRYVTERPGLVRRLSYEELAAVEATLELAIIDSLPLVTRLAKRVTLAHCRTIVSYSAGLDSYFLEVFHATCSKGEALRQLAQRLGIQMSEVVAVGDNYNDREMIELAGLGVAMGNAEPEIIAAADRVTHSNDEDGIAALVMSLIEA